MVSKTNESLLNTKFCSSPPNQHQRQILLRVPPEVKPPPKIPSILGHAKSARKLRQDPRTALMPFKVRETVVMG
jgi:hypothetical protein